MNIKRSLGRLCAVALVALTLSGCAAKKTQMTYFDDITQTTVADGTLAAGADWSVKIVPDDRIAIMVTSLNPAASQIFNLPSHLSTSINPTTGAQTLSNPNTVSTYDVSSTGNIIFPVLGKIHVAGMTTEQLANDLAKRIAEYVEDPIVTVELTNFHVNVLGEVNRPGVVAARGERFTVLDAIAASNDLTQYAVRNNVLLVREENGQKTYHRLDLTDSKFFESPYYYLKQNDMIFVEPNDVKRSNASYNVNNGYRIQVTSAIISACSVVASLVIALCIK